MNIPSGQQIELGHHPLAVEATLRSDIDELEATLARAAAVLQETQGLRSLALANCLEDLGTVRCQFQARYAAGLADLERSVDIWWALPADRRDDFQAAINERYLAENLALMGEWDRAAARYRHCLEVLQDRGGPEHYTVAMARSGFAWVLLHQGRAAEAEQEARAALALGERQSAVMAADQRMQQRLFLGMILTERGQYAEAQSLLEQAWVGEGKADGGGLCWLPANCLLPQRLAEHMLKICVAQGDAAGEAHWREVLAAAKK